MKNTAKRFWHWLIAVLLITTLLVTIDLVRGGYQRLNARGQLASVSFRAVRFNTALPLEVVPTVAKLRYYDLREVAINWSERNGSQAAEATSEPLEVLPTVTPASQSAAQISSPAATPSEASAGAS